jgi:hypothetical protein
MKNFGILALSSVSLATMMQSIQTHLLTSRNDWTVKIAIFMQVFSKFSTF